jgi:hypothetical protein
MAKKLFGLLACRVPIMVNTCTSYGALSAAPNTVQTAQTSSNAAALSAKVAGPVLPTKTGAHLTAGPHLPLQ